MEALIVGIAVAFIYGTGVLFAIACCKCASKKQPEK